MKAYIVLLSLLFAAANAHPGHATWEAKKTCRVKISIATTDDDLRADSYANLYMNNTKIENFTHGQNLKNNTSQEWIVDWTGCEPNVTSVRLEHVSVNHGLDTDDNWNIGSATVSVLNDNNHWEEVAKHGSHRFDGDHRSINLDIE